MFLEVGMLFHTHGNGFNMEPCSRVRRKIRLPHHSRRRKPLQPQNTTAFKCSLVSPRKLPHPHKEKTSIYPYFNIKKRIQKSNSRFRIQALSQKHGRKLARISSPNLLMYKSMNADGNSCPYARFPHPHR